VSASRGDRLRTSSDPTQPSEERFKLAPGFVGLGRPLGQNRSINLFGRASLKQRDDAGGSSRLGVNDYRAPVTFRERGPSNSRAPSNDRSSGDHPLELQLQAARCQRGVQQRGLATDGRAVFAGGTTLFDAQIPEADRPLIDLFPQVRCRRGRRRSCSARDDVPSSRGWLVSTDLDLAGRRVGSEVGYVKTFTQAFAYRRLGQTSRIVVAGGARLGFATGFERSVQRLNEDGGPVLDPDGQSIYDIIKDLPASERFYAGGDTTVRGFALDRLGAEAALDRNGFPTGGNALVIVNGEVRVPVTRTLGGVAFVDAGNVPRASEFDIGSLRATLGLGARPVASGPDPSTSGSS
jgi:outer membrane translocation and assembly module TamA